MFYIMLSNYFPSGFEQTEHVERETDVGCIFTVEACLSNNIQFIATVDLRPARKPGKHIVGTVFLTLVYQVGFPRYHGAGTYETHVAF